MTANCCEVASFSKHETLADVCRLKLMLLLICNLYRKVISIEDKNNCNNEMILITLGIKLIFNFLQQFSLEKQLEAANRDAKMYKEQWMRALTVVQK